MGHARGFRPGFSGVGGGGVLEPWAPSDFLGKSWEIVEAVAKFWESSAGNSGIVRRCTNHAPRTVSCDSAACLTLAAAARERQGVAGTSKRASGGAAKGGYQTSRG